MAMPSSYSSIFVLIALAFSFFVESSSSFPHELEVNMADFPIDFVFGVTTSAVQTEGSANEAGKGPSVWDNYLQKFPERIMDGSNLSTATDSYKRYKKDVKALRKLGVGSYRFSLAWTRILPKGSLSGGINEEGINHYSNLIDELLINGITPFVTLLHFDPPQALTDKYGGSIALLYYSEICFKAYGDRVKNWITINEPLIMAKMGYDLGFDPPARCSVPGNPHWPCTGGNSATEPYTVAHNLLLAHANVVKLYRDHFQRSQGGQIGICVVGQFVELFSDKAEDKSAAQRLLDFEFGWYMEPLTYGYYPKTMRSSVKERLPRFSEEDKKLVKNSFDFIGVNYYTARFGRDNPRKPNDPIAYRFDSSASAEIQNINKVQIGPQSNGSQFIYSYPQGLQKLLEFTKKRYQSPQIYITENGFPEKSDKNLTLHQSLNYPLRIQCFFRHLYYIKMAIQNGVNAKGYFHYTLADDFDFEEGYTSRYGFYYVDRQNNLKRIRKKSAKWFPKFLKNKTAKI